MTAEPVSRAPARLSSGVAIGAALVATLAAALGASVAAGAGALGVLLAALALVRGSRRVLGAGVAALLLGILLSGVAGGSTESLLVAMVATVAAWDVGENAINVGEQLGREANTRRLELTHVASGTAFGAGVAGVGYAIYEAATGGQPASAVALLLLGAVLLLSTLRE